MEVVSVSIRNWEKFNPKRAQKTYTWLRLDNAIAVSPDLFGLTPEQKFVWICVLCEASKKNTSQLEISLDWFEHHLGVKRKVIRATLEFLQSKQVITVSLHHATPALQTTTPTNERTGRDERTLLPATLTFDFEKIYEKYPRKLGKKKGIDSCIAQIKTSEQYDSIISAVTLYAEHCRKERTEPKFIKHFSTFMNSWTDWISPEVGRVSLTTRVNPIASLGPLRIDPHPPTNPKVKDMLNKWRNKTNEPDGAA